jgi:hypothetical protein
MKTYFCVMSEFYRDGKVKTGLKTRRCKEKPYNQSRFLPRMDAFYDWFETEAEASAHLASVQATAEAVA